MKIEKERSFYCLVFKVTLKINQFIFYNYYLKHVSINVFKEITIVSSKQIAINKLTEKFIFLYLRSKL